jgi:molybdate transport system substrate-binding protein
MTLAYRSSARTVRTIGALAIAATIALAFACGGGGDAGEPGSIKGTITVFAASSLADVFNEAGKQFEAKNPATRVTFNFGSSAALATQINEGAPAGVFASANTAQMKVVIAKGNAADARLFATNTLVVVVARGNRSIEAYRDLTRPGLKLVLAAKDVPVGQYARDSLAAATAGGEYGPAFSTHVLANLKSEEANVRAVLTKVQLGEADAGIVYRTDIDAAAADVRQVEIPAKYNIVAEYPVAVTTGSKRPALARAFVDYLLSAEGQAILQKYGFGPMKQP